MLLFKILEKKYHGYNGPVKAHPVGEESKEISQAFVDAGKEIGYKEIDVNGKSNEGKQDLQNRHFEMKSWQFAKFFYFLPKLAATLPKN